MPESALLHLTERDKRAVLYARNLYVAGETSLTSHDVSKYFQCNDREARAILSGLDSLSAVRETTEGSVPRFEHTYWVLLPRVAVLAQQLESPPDRVSAALDYWRRHPWLWVFPAAAAVIIVLDSMFSLIERIAGLLR